MVPTPPGSMTGPTGWTTGPAGPIGFIGLMIVPMGLTVSIAAALMATGLPGTGIGVAGTDVGAAGAGVFPVEGAAVAISNKCGLRMGKRTGLRMMLLGG